ncbi:MAG: YidC/Oxa1 family insertase periplasmic-domain containing protein [Pirellulales bacterium]|nr:YidC/Oxa1 family insertase periplasmic-domain containing protein [Pirellulales bacterium]
MESNRPQGMWGRYALFLAISFLVLTLNMWLNPPQAPKPAAKNKEVAQHPAGDSKKEAPKPDQQQPPKDGLAEQPPKDDLSDKKPTEKPEAPEEVPEPREQWLTIGSVDPTSPYRMLVTLTNRGAAVARIELSSDRYRDLEWRSGYMGHVIMESEKRGAGAVVQVVGRGTPAEAAGIQPGDVIQSIGQSPVTGLLSFKKAMEATEPEQVVSVKLVRNGKELAVPVTLRRRPMEVVRPEDGDPYSFLLTMGRIDEMKLEDLQRAGIQEEQNAPKGDRGRPKLGQELKGTNLRNGNWEVESATQSQVVFRRSLPAWGLQVRKTYRLVEVPPNEIHDPDYKGYHLVFDIQVRNQDKAKHKVAYQLDGPNGLPTEGYWYANKIGRSWGAVGLRDVVVSFDGRVPSLIGAPKIAEGETDAPWQAEPLTFIGVDAQYFATVMIPQTKNPNEVWFGQSQPLRVGPVDQDRPNLVNTSYRVTSKDYDLKPEESVSHSFVVFAGPKRPPLLTQYGLQDIVIYGWFWWVAEPLLWVLHLFYSVVRNYGIAIILLTVVVRGCMFPLSIKQALNAQKMQELQPEIKRIQEKHKKDLEARSKAQQELFRKHNYNPMGGCLVMFLQLPIFIGLYRALMVDVELRQAPLFSESVRWCSNLAAPDMFFNWSRFMPDFVAHGTGFLGLGPYFNLLPIITILLFLWQQKKFMPPPADEQAAMQQKIMQFMMIFMGVLFFKVASGLCLYFIASSLWGIAERRFLPKHAPAESASAEPNTREDRPRSQPNKLDLKSLFRGGANGDSASPRKKRKDRPRR